MARATWNGEVIAESDETVLVEGNHYFPPESLERRFFAESSHTSRCGWKGTASYYDVTVNGQTNESAAWYYPKTKQAAKQIEGYVAFWRGVEVQG